MLFEVKDFNFKKIKINYRDFLYNCNMNVICYFNSIIKKG